jgi:DNA relaxase NicK
MTAEDLAPASNRGAEIRAGLGAICFTVHPGQFADRDDSVNDVMAKLCSWVEGEFFTLEYGWRAYRHVAMGPVGARVCWDDPYNTIHVEVKEGWLAALGQGDRLVEFVEWVNEIAFYAKGDGGAAVRVTRIDNHLDDYKKSVRPSEVSEWVDAGLSVTHAQAQELLCSRKQRGAPIGESFYLGKSGSRRRLNVYDKAVESDGKIDAIRWELREQEEAAEVAFSCLLMHVRLYDSLEGYGKVVAERLVSFVNFVSDDGGTRLDAYRQLVGNAERRKGYELPVPTVVSVDVAQWIGRQVSASLAALFDGFGGDLEAISALLAMGRRKMRVRHRLMASQEFDWRAVWSAG